MGDGWFLGADGARCTPELVAEARMRYERAAMAGESGVRLALAAGEIAVARFMQAFEDRRYVGNACRVRAAEGLGEARRLYRGAVAAGGDEGLLWVGALLGVAREMSEGLCPVCGERGPDRRRRWGRGESRGRLCRRCMRERGELGRRARECEHGTHARYRQGCQCGECTIAQAIWEIDREIEGGGA